MIEASEIRGANANGEYIAMKLSKLIKSKIGDFVFNAEDFAAKRKWAPV